MVLFFRLLRRLGLIRDPQPRKFMLDASLHPLLDLLAQEQQLTPDELASRLLASALTERSTHIDLVRQWESLSTRERQVAALTCLGYTNGEIAERLKLSTETVRTHTRNVQFKFNVYSKADLRVRLSTWDFSEWDKL